MKSSIVLAAVSLLLIAWMCGAAAAAETEVLFGGKTVGDWDTARDESRLRAEFSLSDLSRANDPQSLRWRFISRGVTFNDLFLRKPIARPFSTIRVLVKNDGAPVTLAAKAADADAAEWTANRVSLGKGDGWRWVEFARPAWAAASWSRDADERMDFPLQYFTLICFDVRPGTEYDLRIARVEAVRPDPAVATVYRLELQRGLVHGRSYPVGIRFTIDRPSFSGSASLVFRRGREELFRAPLFLRVGRVSMKTRTSVDARAVIRVPEFAPGGRCTVELAVDDARVRWRGPKREEVTVEARKPGKTVASVRVHNGAPTLFINGKPHNGMAYAAYGPSVEVFQDFAKAGVSLFTFAATPTQSGYGLSRTAWTAPGKYDFSELDRRVRMVLAANPHAYFFPRLYLHAPKWWSEQHPDDIVLMDPGDGKPVPFIHAGGKPAPSWASQAWRRATVEGLKRLIAHVEASPYADRCIGYHLASGTTEEWMMWGANEDEWVDYSPANTAGFRRWLQAKYVTDDRLRSAWDDPAASLGTAAIPTKPQRQVATLGSLRNPTREQPVIDFYLYNSDLVAETIGYFARAVKEITHREKIVGVFYGYLLQLCGEQRQQNAGHLALQKVLASPDVDFVCSPTSYAFRQLGGEGTSHFMSLLGSVKLHGKLWFDENDIRTSLSGGQVGEWGRPANVTGDILQQDKELANVLVNGTAQWWFDVGGNRYNDPVLMKRIGELTADSGSVLKMERTPADQVAMIVDERSLAYLRVGDPLGASLLVSQIPALSRIGAPVGHYLVADLPRIRDRKLFLFVTSFAPTAADRAAIDSLKRDGHVLVFLYAPGTYRDGRLDETGMEALTGIRLRLSRDPLVLRVTLKPGDPLTSGVPGGAYGVGKSVSPICHADDPQATVLGTLTDGRAGLVVKRFTGWTSIYSAAPMLPASLLRNIARMAGVHLYLDSEDVVWASRDLLGICVKDAGPRQVHLPGRFIVRDLYRGATVAEGDSFVADMPERGTRVFTLKPAR